VTENSLTVDFRGRIANDDLPRLLNEAEVFVLPSLYEGNPKALLEAMACGLPVLATNVEGNREVVQHGVTGYLCKDTSAESLREGIEKLLADERLRNTLGRNAREFIEREYALDVLLERELALLATLTRRRVQAKILAITERAQTEKK
jgi:glycosyltransferase involved in cell wall biosynthesis